MTEGELIMKTKRNFWGILPIMLLIVTCFTFELYTEKKQDKVKQPVQASLGSIEDLAPRYTDYNCNIYHDDIKQQIPDNYLIKKNVDFEMESVNDSLYYAAAYNLKTLGFNVTGVQVKKSMKDIEPKLMDAAVRLNTKKTNSTCYCGTLEQLKMRLCNGRPIIVMIPDMNSIKQAVNVVGYDKDNIYLLDSQFDAGRSQDYNRKIIIEEFKSCWSDNNGMGEYVTIDIRKEN